MNDYTENFMQEDILRSKGLSVLSYLGFLFVIPLFMRKRFCFARFHANQGLVLFVAEACIEIVKRIVNTIFKACGFLFLMVGPQLCFHHTFYFMPDVNCHWRDECGGRQGKRIAYHRQTLQIY